MALIKNRLADEMTTYKNKRAAALSGATDNAAAKAAADIFKKEERADLNSSASLPALLPLGTALDTDGALLLPSVKDSQNSFNPERDENGRLALPSAGDIFNGKTGNEIRNRLADEALTYKDRRSAALTGAEKYGADKALQLGAAFDTDGKIWLPSAAGSPFKDNSDSASANTGVKDDSALYVFNPERDSNGEITLPSVLPTTLDRLKNNTIRTERDDRAQFISPNVKSKKTLTAVTDPDAFKTDTQKTAEYAAAQLGRGLFVDAPSNFANTVGSVYAGANAKMNAYNPDENGMLPLQNPAEMKKIYNEAAADYIANSDFTKNIKEAEALSEEAGKGLGSGAKIIGDVSYNIGNMLPSVIISAVSGGAGAPAALKSLLSSGFIAATSYSSAVSEALSEGADADDAMNYGILIAVTEAVGDQLIGGVGSIGEGLLSKSMGKAVTKLFNNIKNESLRAAVKTGADYITKSLLGEGIEEAIETIAGTGAKRITYDKDAAIDWNEVLYSALMGGITGGVYGSFEAGGNYRSNLAQSHFKSLGETLNDPTSVQALIETGLNSPAGSDSYVITTELQNKEKTGQKITDEDIGRLWAANIAQVNSENDTERANLVYKAQEEYENGITGENAKATNALFDAYGVKKRGEDENSADGKFMLAGKNADGIEVYVTNPEVKKLTLKDRKKRYIDYIKKDYIGRTAKFERNGHTYYAQFDQRSIKKHIYGDKRSSTNGVKALTKAGADGDIFDLVENTQYDRSQKNSKNNTNADYFDYFIKTVQIDGKVFDLVVDVEKTYGDDGGYVYSLALRDNKTIKASPANGASQNEPLNSAGNALIANTILPQQTSDVNNSISGVNKNDTNSAQFDASGNPVLPSVAGYGQNGGQNLMPDYDASDGYVSASDNAIRLRTAKEEAISESGRAAGASPADVVSASRVADELGIDVRFYRSQSAEYGYTKNGIIYLNAAADNPVLSTFAHELTHTTEGTEAYRAVLKYVQGRLGDGLADEREKMINRYAYYGVELDDSGADAELTAEIMRKYFLTDERNIRNMVGTDLSLGEKVADFFDGLAVKLAGKPEAKEARKVTEYYRKAVKESRAAKENYGGDIAENQYMLPETDVYNDTQGGAQNDTVTDTEAEGNGEKTPLRSELNAKGKQYLDKVERKLGYSLANALNIPYAIRRDFIKPTVRKLSDAYLENGSIEQKLTDDLFDSAYNEGRVIEREFYDNYKDLKKEIRETKLKVSDTIRGDIADYAGWRKKLFGTLRLSGAEGLPVDTYYQDLSDRYPDLFPSDIENPTDELLKIAEVAQSIQIIESGLDHYYGNNADLYRESQKRAFNRKLQEYYSELDNVRRYAEGLKSEAKETDKAVEPVTDMDEKTVAVIKETWELARRLSREAERAVSRNLLSSSDNKIVKALLEGYIKENQIPDGANRQGILEVYEAKRRYKTVKDGLDDWNGRRKSALYNEARKLLGNTTKWKDKSAGFLYARETFERNIRDIAPDSKTAEKVINTYRTPIRKNEAARIKYLNSLRDKVRALNISRKVEKGNTVSESEAVQHIGEVKYIISTLRRDTDVDEHRTGLSKAQLKLWLDMFMADNPNLDYAKIDTAISKMHEIYDGIYKDLTDSEVRNGYMPTEYRKGYWPHFSEDTPDTLLASFASKFGMDLGGDTLPTTINGITQTFKPGKQYFGHSKQRKGDKTVYDAVRGFDQYIEGASNVIFHTEDIQRLRALSEEIRMSASDDSIRERVMEIRNDDELSEEKKYTLIMKELENAPTALSNFVVDLEEYTNLLAGKKSKLDRGMESLTGRRAYNVCKTIESRIAANMVSINPGSWLTNFIPIHQAGAAISDGSMLKGMFYTLKSIKESDGIDNMSDFLVMRRSSDPLYRKTSEKISDLLSSPMSWIDSFAAGTIVRGRYFDNLKKGMNKEAALAEADSFASSVMAGRAKGDMPTLFGAVNPGTKLLTQFQLEQNNQLSYLLKDLPAEAKKNGGAKRLAAMLVKFALGAYLFNDLYEYIVGRRPAFDVIGILNDTVGDFTGYELPNVAELGTSMIKELRLPSVQDFRTEKKSADDTLENLRKNVVEELPFVGGLLGGGRLPISSALPDLSKISSAVGDYSAGEATGSYAANVIGKELLKPAAYLLPPFGGGQLKKAIEGVDAVSRNGSRTIDKEGNELLQYPVYNDNIGQTLLNYGNAITFGKTSLKEGQDWIERGFGSLSAKATSTYDELMEEGVSGRDAYGAVSTVAEAKKTDKMSSAEAKRAALSGYDGLEDAGKFLVYYNMLARDSTDEKEYTEYDMMTDASELGGDKGAIYRMINDIANAEKLSGKLKTFHESKELGNDVKAELYFNKYASDSQKESLNMLESRGVNKEVYYTFLAGKSLTGAKTRNSVLALIDAMNITDAQKDALYDAYGYAESTKGDAPWNKPAASAATGGTGIPGFPELNLPELNLPEINLPELTVPEITLPSINLPEISLPGIGG